MENELRFVRKPSFKPLLGSIFLGTALGIIGLVIFHWILLSVALAVSGFLIDSLVLYPNSKELDTSWFIDQSDLYYIDTSSWWKKVHLIYLPFDTKMKNLPLFKIKKYQIIKEHEIINTKKIDGGSLQTPLFTQCRYLIIQTDDETLRLNLTWNQFGEQNVSSQIELIKTILDNRNSR
ncbi:hypothetical protein [Companilactobacillus sp. HBUAS59544]|uniref:hypothetical protein n=1 Tax=Companilactobacillus sp. HBUAS59544 TaxID=3109363 RepID=UPI002FEFCCF5